MRNRTSVFVLCTDYGDRVCPHDMQRLFATLRLRKDGQPDRRFTATRAWRRRFKEVEAKLRNAYLGAAR